MIRKLIFTMVFSFVFGFMPAQNVENTDVPQVPADTLATVKKHYKSNAAIMKEFSDSLLNLRASYMAYSRLWDDLDVPMPKKRIKADAYKLYVPPTFYIAPLEEAFALHWEPGVKLQMTACDSLYMARPKDADVYELPDMETMAVVDRWVNKVLLTYYLEHPEGVIGNESYFADLKPLDAVQKNDLPRKEDMKQYMVVRNPLEDTNAEVNLVLMKPNFWKFSGNGKIQFTQNSLSDNWYQGGENTNAMYSELKLHANYDNKRGIQVENSIEMKLGFITAPSDTVHAYKTNSDKIRLYSKLGVRAIKNLYYTVAVEIETQLFPNYRTNSNKKVSDFLTPLRMKFTLSGLDYKYSKNKMSLSVLGSPFTYKHVYLKTTDIANPTSFEVKKGDRHADIFGSELTAKVNWKLRSNITWNSKFDFFTTYEKVTLNWENTIDFKLSRYLSTTLFIHSRFDDGVTLKDGNKSYFQFKEMFTFGLSYSW